MHGKIRLAPYIKAQWTWLLFGSLTGIIMNTSVVLPPILLGKALDAVLALGGHGSGAGRAGTVGHWVLLYFGAMVVYAAGRVGKRYGFRIMANRINSDLRRDLLDMALAWPVARYEREHIGDLMSRAVGDVQVLADAVQVTVTEVFDTALMMLSNLAALLLIQPGLTLRAALPIPLALLAAQTFGPHIFRRATKAREVAAKLNNHLQPMISGVRIFRFLGREEANTTIFAGISEEQKRANVELSLLQGGAVPLYSIIAMLGTLLVLGFGGTLVIQGHWTIGGFTSYLTMFTAMSARTLTAARVINRIHVGRAAWRRISAKLEGAPAGNRSVIVPQPIVERGVTVNVKDLSFAFPGAADSVLRGIDIHAVPGSIVGVTGPVGSGKTALASALSGLYDYKGSVLVNGRELRLLDADERAALISYMGQTDFLFSATIAENITLQPLDQADLEHLDQAVQWAALAEDLPLFPQGYATQIGEGGVKVSGGQRQRIALARALYAGKPLLILDDPFSAVDLATERRIIQKLREAFAGRTIFLCSHRLASFALADWIIVLNHGTVEEQGTHEALMRGEGIYARIYKAQQWMEMHRDETK
ncbi:MAG: ABC transporter ATP-binding protein [Bacteroidota bacterium]